MKDIHLSYLVPALLASMVLGSGCTSMASQPVAGTEDMMDPQEVVISQKEQEIANLQSKVGQLRSALSAEQMKSAAAAGALNTELLPPNAKSGECYARVFIPPTFRTDSERVLLSEATSRITTTVPKFAWDNERVLVKETSSRLIVVPATYEWVEERIQVTPESTRLKTVPAVYKTVTEKVLDKAAHTVWKKGTGPITRIDEATGEIMCLVDVPATYRTVSKRIQVSGPSTEQVVVPAEYRTVKKRVLKTPPATRTIEIPAEYKTVKVKKLVEPATTKTVQIPAQYTTVTRQTKISEGKIEWRPILCKTNTTPDIVARIQTALKNAGHNPGPIDGVIGQQTHAAIRSYQRSKGLATGGLTINTLKSLKVMF